MSKKKVISTDFNFDALVELCQQTHQELRGQAIRSVDIAMVARNWLIGWYIVEYEQIGADREDFGFREGFLSVLRAQRRTLARHSHYHRPGRGLRRQRRFRGRSG